MHGSREGSGDGQLGGSSLDSPEEKPGMGISRRKGTGLGDSYIFKPHNIFRVN